MRYLTVREVLFIHLWAIDFYFAYPESCKENRGISEPELLDSAVALPAQTFGGQELYGDLFWKAAALFRSIIKNHAFVDGNKRTAVLALLVFLDLNGYRLECSDDDAIAFALRVASRRRHSLRRIRCWIKKRSRKHQGVYSGRRGWFLQRLLRPGLKELEDNR
ncbi:MAG: type II toxin-antitoxin system death-on-curing family toxin [Firmicutes bacterium]|nr:type II toxin-antitoxin system death-on-curing family toxin [Bacillota bacterium]